MWHGALSVAIYLRPSQQAGAEYEEALREIHALHRHVESAQQCRLVKIFSVKIFSLREIHALHRHVESAQQCRLVKIFSVNRRNIFGSLV